MKNRIFAYFDIEPNKAYPVVYAPVYTETFNEEINSMSILLDGVDKIDLESPYHFVKITNELEDYVSEWTESDINCVTNLHLILRNPEELPDDGNTYDLVSDFTKLNFTPQVDDELMVQIKYRTTNQVYICKGTVVSIDEHPSYSLAFIKINEVKLIDRFLFNGKDSIIMLLDNFVETQTTLNGEIKYKYQINLMNNVKLLEKIQCPNRVITHSLIDEQTTIYEEIDKYMKLYSPKVKMSTDGKTWSYQYLLDWSGLNISPFNDTYCADMQMNEPTLRQLLTNLMLQVGCIPTINYRTVGAINYNSLQSVITPTEEDGVNFISHSASSDSYANNLVQAPTQALDDKNEVISELIGFRDSSNAIIKQTQNLMLETRFPIYKIKEVLMRNTDNKSGYLVPQNENPGAYPLLLSGAGLSNSDKVMYSPTIIYLGYNSSTGKQQWGITLNITYSYVPNLKARSVKLFPLELHFVKYNSGTGNYDLVTDETVGPINGWDLEVSDYLFSDIGYVIYEDGTVTRNDSYAKTVTGKHTCTFHLSTTIETDDNSQSENFLNYSSHMWLRNAIYDSDSDIEITQFLPLIPIIKVTKSSIDYFVVDTKHSMTSNNDNLSFNTLYPSSQTEMEEYQIPANIGSYVDITDLFVEQRKRQLLDTDYTHMLTKMTELSATLSDLSKYVYGTIGYQIGSNKMTGFSQTYSRAQMWWSVTRSYFDNILEFIQDRKDTLLQFSYEEFNQRESTEISDYLEKYGYAPLGYAPLELNSQNFKVDIDSGVDWLNTNYSKMKFLFFIKYQPLNNLKVKVGKQDKNYLFDIEQLNQSGDGLSDYTRLMRNVQETADRIGNKVKSIPQVTENSSKLYPLNGLYEGFTIFHRQIAIYENYLSVTYTASEDYVIKNYFTSIITKYRAYEYVDYNQSVERKENTKVYCMISDKHYYDGDDKISWFDNIYSLDDLADILGVTTQVINLYINYSPTGTNVINLFKNIGFKYDIARTRKAAALTNSGYEYYTNQYIYITTMSTDSNSVCSTEYIDRDDYSNPYRFIFDDYAVLWLRMSSLQDSSSALKEITRSVEQCMKDNKSELYSFFSNLIPAPYITNYTFETLKKLDGQILNNNNSLYRIHINLNENSNVSSQGYIRVGSNSTLTNIFDDAATIAQTNLRKNWMMYSDLKVVDDPSKYLEDIFFTYNTFMIYLELLSTKEEEKERARIAKINDVLVSGVSNLPVEYKFRYAIESSYNSLGEYEEVKNECSVLNSDNSIVINYQDYDNVSAGPCLNSLTLSTSVAEGAGGGYVQKWQVWDYQRFGESHNITFAYDMKLKLGDESNINDYIAQLPVINKGWIYKPYTILEVVDNNKLNSSSFTFYKDNAEVLNHTIQFEFYSDKNEVLFSPYFIERNSLVNKMDKFDTADWTVFDITDEKFEMNNSLNRTVIFEGYGYGIETGYDENLKLSFIQVNWEDINSEVEQIVISIVSEDLCRDMMAFKRNGRTENTKYYATLNDTKTNDVMYFSDPNDLFELYECENSEFDENTSTLTNRKCKKKNL